MFGILRRGSGLFKPLKFLRPYIAAIAVMIAVGKSVQSHRMIQNVLWNQSVMIPAGAHTVNDPTLASLIEISRTDSPQAIEELAGELLAREGELGRVELAIGWRFLVGSMDVSMQRHGRNEEYLIFINTFDHGADWDTAGSFHRYVTYLNHRWQYDPLAK